MVCRGRRQLPLMAILLLALGTTSAMLESNKPSSKAESMAEPGKQQISLENIVAGTTTRWNVPHGYVNFRHILTMIEMSDRLALWATDPSHKRPTVAPSALAAAQSKGATTPRVTWKGCRARKCPENDPEEAAVNIPRTDKQSENGIYTLFEVVEGYVGIQSVVFVCLHESCRDHKGVYLAFSPIAKGFQGKMSKAGRALRTSLKKRPMANGEQEDLMTGWGKFYASLAVETVAAVRDALQLCDARTGSKCPLYVGGNSMAGQMVHYFALDVVGFIEKTSDQDPNFSPDRLVSFVTVGAPRGLTSSERTRIDAVFDGSSPTRPPVLRLVNDGDLVPAFPAASDATYDVNQAGFIIGIPNPITSDSGETIPATVRSLACHSGSSVTSHYCVSAGCDPGVRSPLSSSFSKSFKDMHDAFVCVEPNLILMMREMFSLETAAEKNEGSCQLSGAVVSGVSGAGLASWIAHGMQICEFALQNAAGCMGGASCGLRQGLAPRLQHCSNFKEQDLQLPGPTTSVL